MRTQSKGLSMMRVGEKGHNSTFHRVYPDLPRYLNCWCVAKRIEGRSITTVNLSGAWSLICVHRPHINHTNSHTHMAILKELCVHFTQIRAAAQLWMSDTQLHSTASHRLPYRLAHHQHEVIGSTLEADGIAPLYSNSQGRGGHVLFNFPFF